MAELANFAGKHPFLMLAVVLSLCAVIVYELRQRGRGSSQISANDAVRLINKGATIVDVRKADDYGAGHIVNARNVALADIEADPARAVTKSKTRALLTVCENGSSAAKAAELLRRAGYETVFSLRGGLAGWRADNLPLVK
jgi:rhodanese-related sulfurtransferase